LIQGTNANALKIALVKLFDYFESNGYGFILMNIHDEVVCEVLEDKAEEVAAKIKEVVSASLSYFLTEIKGGASCKIGDKWKK